MPCDHCPVKSGACRAEADPAYSVFCRMAEGGEPSQLAAIVAASPDAPAPEYPSLAQQAVNLAGSFATWLRAGCPVTPKAERERRRAICLRCPSGMFDLAARRCRECGCYGDLKPWMATAVCRLGHHDIPPEQPTVSP